ncbi:EF-hand domain-containing protein [Nocardiopsis aegyptia]|uniref:Ca2+-binding EF-hand superfamily protein n=1 Tax=Nocardiopsis aegyptia TaxID=220378 RepID=A0A7Z0J968_9ACTN|nr:EF-hand domain-containing protein [Nocardiopsis aegyptia]NYJ33184.1 Ca2+-binding EF-hand superfamily protein [Nocardiopsis aegyptia]
MAVGVKENTRLEERFRLWDSNGNGVIERSDFESEADGIINALGAQGSAAGTELKRAYLAMFDHLANAAGTNRMDKAEFLRVAEQEIISKGDAGFSSVVAPTIQAIVNVLDTDNDGEVSPSEMAKWFDAIGLDQSAADEAFRQLDADGSGQLSVSELVDAVRDYHLGRNDIPLLGA